MDMGSMQSCIIGEHHGTEHYVRDGCFKCALDVLARV